ncbi:SRPBCC domain-containing protein [Pseudalkalibacillus sp. SCS-8]|uniref:SRPBCC family protein n=1 Tax=Pseudalkalibacillus nanhaiensis TaxID=3115291 RepID=UPI0032DB806A
MPNDFRTELTVEAPRDALYKAIYTEDGVRGWWTRFADIGEQEGTKSTFRFPAAGFYVITRTEELTLNEQVIWKVVESKHPESSGFEDLEDWTGTTIRFQIEPAGDNQSKLVFVHEGLTPQLECYDACERGWGHYIHSLKSYVETGEGSPYDDDSVDNIKWK